MKEFIDNIKLQGLPQALFNLFKTRKVNFGQAIDACYHYKVEGDMSNFEDEEHYEVTKFDCSVDEGKKEVNVQFHLREAEPFEEE